MSSNVSWFKMLGAILLVVGTSVGGGMLALPVATASLGFGPSAIYLFLTWFVMAMGALFIIEVNAWLPASSNLISMAGATIGRTGQILAWVSYLLLLYSLLSAYVAGGQDVVLTIFSYMGVHLTTKWSAFIFVILFGAIVYFGIRSVDWANKFIMVIKLLTYLTMIVFTLPYIHFSHLVATPLHLSVTLSTIMIMITSYGFAIIVPSLRTYFNSDIKALRKAVVIGSCIPLVVYLVWEAVIFSVLPKVGKYSLHALATSSEPVSTLMHVLSHLSQHSWIIMIANVFTSVCVITAFLGVSLCLVDFLADGFQVSHRGKSSWILYGLTFVPPLLLVLFAQKVFVMGLSFAGICCVFLLMLLPAWMAWMGRYKRQFSDDYRVFGGKAMLIFVIAVSIALFILVVVQRFFPGWL